MDIPTIPRPKGVASDQVLDTVNSYLKLHDDQIDGNKDQRLSSYAPLVNHFYNLVTDFYEWGWGQSFHFTIQHQSESFETAIARHEYYLALRLGLQKGMKVLDVGCGVGGPARNIANFTSANIVGLNNNQYQIDRCNDLTEKNGMTDLVSYVKADFMKQPFEDNTFDAVYQIEATAHAPSKVGCYREIYRVLKPGQLFAGYEWCLTDLYDPSDPQHRRIKKGIEEGNGLPDISTCDQVVEALKQAGFEIIECKDLVVDTRKNHDLPWYYYLTPSYVSPVHIQNTPLVQWTLNKLLNIMETVHLVPPGTANVNKFLLTALSSLVAAGERGIMTPCFFHFARKPLTPCS